MGVLQGQTVLVEAMLKSGARADAKNRNSASPLELASMYPIKQDTVAVLQNWMQKNQKNPEVTRLQSPNPHALVSHSAPHDL